VNIEQTLLATQMSPPGHRLHTGGIIGGGVALTLGDPGGKPVPPGKLIGWTARFLGMVSPGDEIEIRADRVGIDLGAEVLEVTAKVGGNPVMSATARMTSPKTAYAFPGQGIQHTGMGMDVRARSKAARAVWDRADAFTRDHLGFSILHIVRDNPTTLIAGGVHYQHPEGC
jgi:fatty acid synthase